MSRQLDVGNLPEQISSNVLAIPLVQAGAVKSAQIIATKVGNSPGFRFVAMETHEIFNL